MIKKWLITASSPFCGTDTYYRAYSEVNPELLESWDSICDGIIQELWDMYNWCLHLDEEEYESEEEEEEAYQQACEDWKYDCSINVDEATEEDFEDNAPGGDIEAMEVVYDEREK